MLASLLLLEACYYLQAARGQLDVLHRRRPVDEVIANADSPEPLRARLRMFGEAREFAVHELLLPDNDSYRSYADMERDYVVWNVIAAPEFSLEPRKWCYPIAGCVAYRGYFSEASARKLAAKLESHGFDVVVGGVAAYSTLGRFADPLLSTMMRWTDDDLVATLFHELAHQKLYIKGDTQFNESFATIVAETGLERWHKSRGESADGLQNGRRTERKALLEMVSSTRDRLQSLYASGLDQAEMREQKREIFAALEHDARELAKDSNSTVDWLGGTLNNARLASIGLYEGRVDAFRKLLRDCGADLRCFYAQTEDLAAMNKDARDAELDRISMAVTPDE